MNRPFLNSLLAILLASAAGSSAAECREGLRCSKEAEARKEITTKSGTVLTGIVHKRLRMNAYEVLKFQRANGFKVTGSQGQRLERIPTSGDFVDALEQLIVQLRKEGRRVDQVQLDMDAVGDAWSEFQVAVRKAALAGKGPLHNKDPQVTRALRGAIGESKLVKATCEMVRLHRMECVLDNGFTESVAFLPQYASGDRQRIARADGAGLLPSQAFAIAFKDAVTPVRKSEM